MRFIPGLTLIFISSVAFVRGQSTPRLEPIVRGETVTVTELLLTESPATVSRLGFDYLPQSKISLPELAARAANFFESTNDAHSFNDTFALRGLTNTPIFGDPAISFYLDDLPLGSGFTFPTSLAGFARAELHRGPSQNTVFGRAGSAGVVTLTTPEPGTAARGEIDASYGNYSARAVSASASTAAHATADAYVNAAYSARDGYLTNTRLGRDIDGKESSSALARFRFRPTPGTELTFLGTALHVRDGVQPLVPLGGPLFTVTRKTEGYTALDAANAALKAVFTTPIGLLSATTSLNRWDLGPYASVLAFGPSELFNGSTLNQKNWHQEVKLASPGTSAVRWQIGAIYTDGDTDGGFTRAFGPYVIEKSSYVINARDLAAFGEATFRLSSDLRFTVGLRAEDSRKTMQRDEFIPVRQVFDLQRASTALLPKLALNYTLDRETNLFASLGAGYKPGGFSAFTGNRALASFAPERTKTFETGITRASTDKTISATLRFFYYDITGYQIERSFATTSVADDYLVVNAPRARSFGSELELTWKPFPGVTLAADLGTTDVTLREFRDPYTGKTFKGKRAPYVPLYDASLRADYAHASGFFGGLELTANGRTFYTESENLALGQRSYALLGARFGYSRGNYRVTAYGENLTDIGYYSAIAAGTGHGTPGAPRTYGVEFTLKF